MAKHYDIYELADIVGGCEIERCRHVFQEGRKPEHLEFTFVGGSRLRIMDTGDDCCNHRQILFSHDLALHEGAPFGDVRMDIIDQMVYSRNNNGSRCAVVTITTGEYVLEYRYIVENYNVVIGQWEIKAIVLPPEPGYKSKKRLTRLED